MGEQFKIIEYPLIIIFIITGGVFLISTSDLVSIFLSIELQSYGLYLLSTIYRDSEPATSGGLMYFLLGGTEWFRKSFLFCLKLSNSGDALKLKVPSCIWKDICVWANYLFTVTILKMWETKIGYRGSKSIKNNFIVKEQRVDGSSPIFSQLIGVRCTLRGFERNSQIRILSNQINLINKRLYTTKVQPVMTYSNADTQKLEILQDNNKKSGVYRWVNKETGESYVGSSVNINKRLHTYYSLVNVEKILSRSKSHVLNALFKYGYSKFSFEILEYCSAEECIRREQYYIDSLNPEYNLKKKAGSSFGYKYAEETRAKMSEVKKGEANPMFGKNHSEETRAKISNAQKGRSRTEGSGKPSQKIEILDIKNNISTIYDSMSAAALDLKIGQSTISKYLARSDKKVYNNQYVFKKL